MDLKEEDILGDKIGEHWYYVSKGRAMRAFLGDLKANQILDVGAGSGIFSKQLLDLNIAQSAVCVDPNYPEERREDWHGKSIEFVKSLKSGGQELVLMMDVLEHVPDDVALLKEYVDQMPKGAHLLITVPAFQFMWSGHDVFLEHYRRYTIEMMETATRKAGLTPIKSRYFFGALFPVVAIIRLAKKLLLERGQVKAQSELKLYPDGLNKTLIAIHDIERQSLFNINKLYGLSVFCLCTKD